MKKCWCIPATQSASFVAAMEDVLEVYSLPFTRSLVTTGLRQNLLPPLSRHGCRRRSAPDRSGASQFALWTSPPVGCEAISEEHSGATAAGGGTQDANCAAPERMSPTYCRHNVYHTDSKTLYRLKRFLCTKRKILKPFVQLKTFSWYHLHRRPSLSSSLRRHGCRRRSVPDRSGVSQFARWAPPAVGYVTVIICAN